MIQEAIDKVVELTKQTLDKPLLQTVDMDFDGLPVNYLHKVSPGANGRELGDALQPFRPATLKVSTLTGLIDATAAGVVGELKSRIVHVEDYLTVSVKTIHTDDFGVRNALLTAKYSPIGAFTFDEYMAPDKFIIALQTQFLFLEGDDSLAVLRVCSNLKAGDTVHSQDDGVNQTVTLKVGQVETMEAAIKPRVKLTPIRTFSEAAPVQGEFLIRFKPSGGGLPLIALFNLSGIKWQADAMQSIKTYLTKNLPEGTAILA